VTSESLARSYLVKAQKRLKALAVLRDEDAHSDVVREAQELVELALKGVLRAIGVEPPKFHDVGGLLIEHRGKLAPEARADSPARPRSRSGCVVSGSSPSPATSISSRRRNTRPPMPSARTRRRPGCSIWPHG